jgi:hypothetical protein
MREKECKVVQTVAKSSVHDILILVNKIPLEVEMPATKRKKKVTRSVKAEVTKVEKQVTVMSEQLNMLLLVFALAMMAFAYVLYKVYVK